MFIALQALGPFFAFLMPAPQKVQRTDGLPVRLFVEMPLVQELKATAKLFFSKRFLLSELFARCYVAVLVAE